MYNCSISSFLGVNCRSILWLYHSQPAASMWILVQWIQFAPRCLCPSAFSTFTPITAAAGGWCECDIIGRQLVLLFWNKTDGWSVGRRSFVEWVSQKESNSISLPHTPSVYFCYAGDYHQSGFKASLTFLFLPWLPVSHWRRRRRKFPLFALLSKPTERRFIKWTSPFTHTMTLRIGMGWIGINPVTRNVAFIYLGLGNSCT